MRSVFVDVFNDDEVTVTSELHALFEQGKIFFSKYSAPSQGNDFKLVSSPAALMSPSTAAVEAAGVVNSALDTPLLNQPTIGGPSKTGAEKSDKMTDSTSIVWVRAGAERLNC